MKNVKAISLTICIAIFNFIVSCGDEDLVSYSLTVRVEPDDGGSVSQGSENFTSGEKVTLIATANSNYSFSTWTGSGISVGLCKLTTDPSFIFIL